MDGILTIGEVVESRADGFDAGDTVWHASGWRDYAVVEAGKEELRGVGTLTRLDTTIAPPQAYLGVLGANGLTAYAGLFRVGALREGDVVWVSAAAGAVGGLAAQMAKIRGHRVIGSAGSDEKVRVPARRARPRRRVQLQGRTGDGAAAEAAPDGIDVYYDNVGGDHLEAALAPAARRPCRDVRRDLGVRRLDPKPGPTNLFLCVAKDLTIRGFRGSSHVDLFDEMRREVGGWYRDGRISTRRRSSTASSTRPRRSPG